MKRLRTTVLAATALTATVALAAPALAAAPASHGPTRKAVEGVVQQGVPGVTLTARENGATWSMTAGVGNLRTGKPRSAGDHYRVGSITKTFVATVLLQLEAEGRLSLDDTVEKWLPGVVHGNGHDGSRITLRQLLNHTSGIYNYTEDEQFGRDYFLKDGFYKNRFTPRTPSYAVGLAMSHAPNFEPGTDWLYSNTNFILAGMVIEKATGHPYGAEVRTRIINPLHLKGTSVPGNSVTLPRPASRAYGKLAETADGPTYDVTELNPSIAGSAGEMISTSADLTRFYSALLQGKLLPPAQLKEMKTVHPASGYGLGIGGGTLSCGVTVWGHDGGIHGSSSVALTTADGKHAVAFNLNADWTGDVVPVIEAEFCGNPAPGASRSSESDLAVIQDLAK
ncbi:serine hydrolase domain-containing protein [Streptomyces acidiscabies]|uniref:Serine hydrolase n=1 Tax=Streptomyces acidiscabies TaxID=42234 RepID=A0AAP6EHN8_9ACTN|nr:serine hydrolase domain-containing protein [Streptomyces acidiscabies]MBP5939604.1 beta-lactamase family protein [Streptomyces sp. LBUM 1476]MBZ3910769.1 beta-lactamase family protein [Streptomyces acidiscabies]MDX2963048.1 serine hydrolase [Streptomyces acidiscabies]MDX3017406.1 serine hydrolase [Streptomyces acidiscabies]MDX3787882.1 serine hydrolase [Streptomyces acidiscabies]